VLETATKEEEEVHRYFIRAAFGCASGKKSLFGGFGKGRESLDAYATADVAWSGANPVFRIDTFENAHGSISRQPL
jgi:hypothetical protein